MEREFQFRGGGHLLLLSLFFGKLHKNKCFYDGKTNFPALLSIIMFTCLEQNYPYFKDISKKTGYKT